MDGSTALAILDKKINSVESTVQSVTLGSDKKSIVITTVDGVSFSVSIPNAVDNPTLLNKFTVANGELYYDGKRIAECTEIPTTTSQLTNDSGFITSANLPNLAPYQPKNDDTLATTNKTIVGAINELKTNVNNISVPTKTSQLTNDSGYITNSDIPTIPSKVSQLANDSNYVTQTEMTDAIAGAVSGGTVDLTGYQKSNDINLATTNKTVVGAINELKDSIDNFKGGTGEGLTNEEKQHLVDAYAHSQSPHVSANDIPTKVSQLNNDSGFITSIPEEYVTDTELNTKGYLTEHQDISGLQPKSDTTLATSNKTISGAINELKEAIDNGTGGSGITDEEKQQLQTAYEHSQSSHVSIADIPTKVSELTNDSNFYVAPTTGKVCTTTVEDNTGTIMLSLPSNFTGVNNGAYVKYKIVNGWCMTSFTVGVTAITTSVSNYAQCATGLPPSAGTYYTGLFSENGNMSTQVTVMFRTDGTMRILAKGNNVTAQDFYLGNFTYPVKES